MDADPLGSQQPAPPPSTSDMLAEHQRETSIASSRPESSPPDTRALFPTASPPIVPAATEFDGSLPTVFTPAAADEPRPSPPRTLEMHSAPMLRRGKPPTAAGPSAHPAPMQFKFQTPITPADMTSSFGEFRKTPKRLSEPSNAPDRSQDDVGAEEDMMVDETPLRPASAGARESARGAHDPAQTSTNKTASLEPAAPHTYPDPLPSLDHDDATDLDLSSPPSSPLSSVGSFLDDAFSLSPSSRAAVSSPATNESHPAASPSDEKQTPFEVDYDHESGGQGGSELLRLKPTAEQWEDFEEILKFARSMGAEKDGCFKVVIPDEELDELPEKHTPDVAANAYRIRQIKRNGFWQVTTVESTGTFSSANPGPEFNGPVDEAMKTLKKMFNKNRDKQIRSVRYRADVPAWTPQQRRVAGVPEVSPIHPLSGDKLEYTKGIVPGIHTPYVYESGPFFGATFQIHAEDFRLCSLNHLYKGRKIWVVVPSTDFEVAEAAFGRKTKCSQFMRHRAEFFFPEKLTKMGIPHRVVDQRPGETIVILPDAYHEGFSTGYTLAEAKNYAEADWSIDAYQPCEASCKLLTMIGADLMRLVEGDDDVRLDLCGAYDENEAQSETLKRNHEDDEIPNGKRVKT